MPAETLQVVEESVPASLNGLGWTKELASALGKRSAAARRAKKLLLATGQMSAPQVEPVVNGATEQPTVAPSVELACARNQLAQANGKLTAALEDDDTEAVNVERLTRAVASLREQVRILEGRPLPGARRPGPERVRREGPAAPLD